MHLYDAVVAGLEVLHYLHRIWEELREEDEVVDSRPMGEEEDEEDAEQDQQSDQGLEDMA